MANVVIWGRAREIVTGELPPSASSVEVHSFAALRARLEGAGPCLVLADPALLAADRAELEAWIRAEGATQAVLVAVVDHAEAEETLNRFPFLDEVLLRPVTAARLRLRLERAFETVHNRRVIRQLERALSRKGEELHTLNNIGVALSAERDINKLLELILAKSREITAADAGSLYLVERGKEDEATSDDQLRFKLAQNDSVVVPFEESVIPLDQTSIAGHAALSGQSVNVADAYHLPAGSPFKVSRSFDEKSGYRTKSMLAVPMRDHHEKVIGVVQLINKKRDPKVVLRPAAVVDESVIPFTSVDEELVTSLASQAAVALENTRLIADIRNLFDSFVDASVIFIEKRDPTTSGHSFRVATLTVGLAQHVDAATSGPFRDQAFTKDQLQEIRYASLLHDFGKVAVREHVLVKGKKLFEGEEKVVQQRFAYIKRSLEAEHLQAKLDQVLAGRASPELLKEMDANHEARQREIDQILKMIEHANVPTILEEESVRALLDLPNRSYRDVQGNRQPFLTPEEVGALSIRKGSLTEAERRAIESHVTETYEFLARIPWTGEFKRVPEIAHAHHEKLDGSGYPRRLQAKDIPIQSRMMTISDIFDALQAFDRPYKKAVPIERALEILVDEAKQGKIDKDLLSVFIGAKVYAKAPPRAGAEVGISR